MDLRRTAAVVAIALGGVVAAAGTGPLGPHGFTPASGVNGRSIHSGQLERSSRSYWSSWAQGVDFVAAGRREVEGRAGCLGCAWRGYGDPGYCC